MDIEILFEQRHERADIGCADIAADPKIAECRVRERERDAGLLRHFEGGVSQTIAVESEHPVAPRDAASWSFAVQCPDRGRFDLGQTLLRVWDRSGLRVAETRVVQPVAVAVYPAVQRLRQVPQPLHTQSSFGNYVSARVGEGIEPGELRPFAPGDRIRHINWRATARRRELYVTRFQEERNADVVLLLDALSD